MLTHVCCSVPPLAPAIAVDCFMYRPAAMCAFMIFVALCASHRMHVSTPIRNPSSAPSLPARSGRTRGWQESRRLR